MARIPFFLLVLFVIYSCSKAETTVTPDATSPPDEMQTEEVSSYLVTAEPAVSHTAALLTSILDLVAITVVFTAKILYSAVIMLLEFIKHIFIKLAEMIIKSVLGKVFSILAIVATIYSIYIILTTGSWQEALTQLSVLALEFWNFFYL